MFFCDVASAGVGAEPSPPGQASSGYGSTGGYISPSYATEEFGSARAGTRAWTFIPDALKNRSSAPVVIYLHGYSAYVPDLYIEHIEHLCKQGYIVIFPQYQRSGVIGLMSDVDQNAFLDRAISSARAALDRIGEIAELENIVVMGHSLGGLLSYCWNPAGGPQARAVVMMNAGMDSEEGVPDFIPLEEIEWRSYAPEVDVPVMLLTGEEDPLEPQSEEAYDRLSGVPSKVLYMAQSDAHGEPDLVADHMAPLSSNNVDALNWRFYYAAGDAALDGQAELNFDMGAWSDGQAVNAVIQLSPGVAALGMSHDECQNIKLLVHEHGQLPLVHERLVLDNLSIDFCR